MGDNKGFCLLPDWGVGQNACVNVHVHGKEGGGGASGES